MSGYPTKVTKFLRHNKIEIVGVVFLLAITIFLRFYQIGYSDFYGDETKTFYWNKTVPATQFLLDQRKGPVQFLIVWAMEKATGAYSETTTRLPFALASTLSVFALYFFMRRRYSKEAAFFGSLAFSLIGFSIAFGRTVQYQSFLFLFGLLGLLFADMSKDKRSPIPLVLAGLFLGLAFLTHYDAILFAIPTIYLLTTSHKGNPRRLFIALIPFLALVLAFYLPYFLESSAKEEVIGYLRRRRTGNELRASNSLYTFSVYNPSFVWAFVFAFSIIGFIKAKVGDRSLYLLWFIIPFVLFEGIFSNPGTHIFNYMIPLIILFGMAASSHRLMKYSFGVILAVVLVVSVRTYIPKFNTGYPWATTSLQRMDYQIFLYGFPYNRGWNEIAGYLRLEGIRSFYTDDNVTVGEWYLLGIPADKYNPHYFIHIVNNQEFKGVYSIDTSDDLREMDLYDAVRYYELVKEIYVDDEKTADIYKKIPILD